MDASVADTGVTSIRAAVDELLATDFAAVPARELAGLLSGLEVQRRRLEAVDARLIAGLAGQATPAQFGATSVPDLIGGLTRVTRAQGRVRAQRAMDVVDRRTLTGEALAPIHPRTAAALAAGEISGAHVDVITHYLGRIPPAVAMNPVDSRHGPCTVFEAGEAFLVDAARHEDPATLRRSGELLLARVDPDGPQPRDQEQERRRGFGFGGRGGPNAVHGELTGETKAVWEAILDSLAAPRPGPDGQRDPRTAWQRNHDGFLEAGLRLLRCGTLPATGGVPVSIIVRLDAADMDKAARGEPGPLVQSAHGDLLDAHRFLRLAGDAQLTTVALTDVSWTSCSASSRTRADGLDNASSGGWGAVQGSSLTARSSAPSARTEPNADPPLPPLRTPPPQLRNRRVDRGHDRRHPPLDTTRLARPGSTTKTQHRPPPPRRSPSRGSGSGEQVAVAVRVRRPAQCGRRWPSSRGTRPPGSRRDR